MRSLIRLPRSWYPADSVDEWGRDARLVSLLTPAFKLRWDVSVGGIDHLPKRDGALLVTNSRRFSLSSVYAAWSLSDAIARPVRFGGRPDIAPLGAWMQRFGGLVNDPEEITAALRAGELDGDKPASKSVTPAATAAAPATELDQESPTAAHRRGGWGYGGGYGGYRGGYGGYRSWAETAGTQPVAHAGRRRHSSRRG